MIKESHTKEIAENIPAAKLSIIKGNHFLQGYGGTPPDGAPSVFMFRELGIRTMDLELVL